MIRLILIIVIALFSSLELGYAAPSYYVASNIPVLIEGTTSTNVRDEALLKAQKLALSQFVPINQAAKLTSISDVALGRTMKDFSLQNERVLSQSYQAQFTIRFDANRFEGLLRSYNLPLPPVKELDLSQIKVTSPEPQVDGSDPTATPVGDTIENPSIPTVVLLPVLNTGSRYVLWDDSNAWRDAWQNQKVASSGTQFVVPLGDVDDVTDAPDTGFLKQKGQPQPGLDNLLKRYNASTLYLLLAQNQGKGLAVKLYRYHDAVLDYKGNITTTSRPGYLFNDAVATTAGQIDRLEHGQSVSGLLDTAKQQPATSLPEASLAPAPAAGNLVLTIPISGIASWIPLQQQLRQTPGIRNLVTQSISANQAVVKIDSAFPPAQMVQNLQNNGFVLQQESGTRYTLFKQ